MQYVNSLLYFISWIIHTARNIQLHTATSGNGANNQKFVQEFE